MTTQQHPDFTYIQLIKQIMEEGYEETGRNGKTKELFGASMRFSLSQNKIPLLTTKKVAWKTCLKELLWFIRGDTNNESLNKDNVHIWDSNGSRSFLDNVGLSHYQVNELGPIYGHQWRKFNAPYIRLGECKGERGEREEREEKGVDQLQNIIDLLKNKNTKLVLYTYDAFLFDVDDNEIDTIEEIKQIFSKYKLTVKAKTGLNYEF